MTTILKVLRMAELWGQVQPDWMLKQAQDGPPESPPPGSFLAQRRTTGIFTKRLIESTECVVTSIAVRFLTEEAFAEALAVVGRDGCVGGMRSSVVVVEVDGVTLELHAPRTHVPPSPPGG